MPVALLQRIAFGDTADTLRDHAQAAAHLFGGGTLRDTGTLVGDALALSRHAVGGNDTLTSDALGGVMLIGDAITVTDHARGGTDNISGGSRGEVIAFGDALTLSGHARGGDDGVEASAAFPTAYGDAETITGHAMGGDDLVTGSRPVIRRAPSFR